METTRLHLRERTAENMQRVLNAEPAVQYAFFGLDDAEALKKELERITKGLYNNFYTGIYFDLIRKGNEAVIGSAGFHTYWRDHDRAELGYSLNQEAYKRNGYMKEALDAILKYGFDVMQLHRIEALTAQDNVASIGLLQQFGFQFEATIHGRYKMPDGSYEDDNLYYLLNPKKID